MMRTSNELLKVGEAIVKTEPEKVIPLYQELVEITIAEKQRKSYRIAVKYLVQIKQIYQTIKQLGVTH